MYQSDLTSNYILINNSLPHNFLVEKTILSCLLINSDAIEITSRAVPIEAFYFKNHQEIYRAIIFIHKNNYVVDIITLVDFLQNNVAVSYD